MTTPVRLEAAVGGALGQTQGQRGQGGQLLREHVGGRQQLGGLDHAVDQADAFGLLGAQQAPGEHQLQRAREADGAAQEVGAAVARDQADLDEGGPELGVARRDPQVAHAREVEAGADRRAVDRGDDRLLGQREAPRVPQAPSTRARARLFGAVWRHGTRCYHPDDGASSPPRPRARRRPPEMTDGTSGGSTATTMGGAVCGDGELEQDEQCDDGNAEDLDECSNDCISAYCGDGVEQLYEDCEDGNNMDPYDDCRTNRVAAECGDGWVQANVDQCDDGNLVDDDGCDGNCLLTPKFVFVTSTVYPGDFGGCLGPTSSVRRVPSRAACRASTRPG